jgi:hypothetical protein
MDFRLEPLKLESLAVRVHSLYDVRVLLTSKPPIFPVEADRPIFILE